MAEKPTFGNQNSVANEVRQNLGQAVAGDGKETIKTPIMSFSDSNVYLGLKLVSRYDEKTNTHRDPVPKITGWGTGRHGRSKARYPEGFIDIYGENGIMGPRTRWITSSYLDRVLKGKSTVVMRQNYIRKIVRTGLSRGQRRNRGQVRRGQLLHVRPGATVPDVWRRLQPRHSGQERIWSRRGFHRQVQQKVSQDVVQMIDFLYLIVHLERTPIVAARQHYATKLLQNPRTSTHDKREILAYIRRRPDLFVPYDEVNGIAIENEIARKKNGPGVRFDFRSWAEIRFAS